MRSGKGGRKKSSKGGMRKSSRRVKKAVISDITDTDDLTQLEHTSSTDASLCMAILSSCNVLLYKHCFTCNLRLR